MPAVKFAATGFACAAAAMAVSDASASLSAYWEQSASSTGGYVLNQLKVDSTTDWIAGAILVELGAGAGNGELLYYTPGVDPTDVNSTYSGASATRTFGGNPLDPINSNIPGSEFSTLPDVASLLDNPTPLPAGQFYPAVATTKEFDLTWFGPPDQTDDDVSAGTMNLADVTGSNLANGTWSVRLSNQEAADDLLISGIVFHGMLLDAQPIAGDANLDGTVNGQDLAILAANFGSSNDVWLRGEFSGDGAINGQDLAILAANFGSSESLSELLVQHGLQSVPEPSGLALLALGFTFTLGRRRDK